MLNSQTWPDDGKAQLRRYEVLQIFNAGRNLLKSRVLAKFPQAATGQETGSVWRGMRQCKKLRAFRVNWASDGKSLTRLSSTMNRPCGQMPTVPCWLCDLSESLNPAEPQAPRLRYRINTSQGCKDLVRGIWKAPTILPSIYDTEISDSCIRPTIFSKYQQTSRKYHKQGKSLPGQAEGGLCLVKEISASGPAEVLEQHYETSTTYPAPK